MVCTKLMYGLETKPRAMWSNKEASGVMPGTFGMYLSRAGEVSKAGETEMDLELFKVHIVCPADFKRGFSIRCEPNPSSKKLRVKFYLDSRVSKIETRPPYFLKGVSGTRIRPFFFSSRKWVRITCRAEDFVDAWVLLRKSCDSRDLWLISCEERIFKLGIFTFLTPITLNRVTDLWLFN